MKTLKKALALVLCLVMVMGLSVAALAAEGEEEDPTKTTTLTIDKTAAGHTYEIYQMLTGDVSGLVNGQGTLANVTAGVNLSGTAEEFDAAIKSGDVYKTDTDLAAAASDMINDVDAYASIEGDGTAKTAKVAPGYYVVKDVYTDSKIEWAAHMVAVVGATTMKPKASIPDIDKNITDTDANKAIDNIEDDAGNVISKKTDTAAIGDVIHYESTSVVPVTEGYKYYTYKVTDTMSNGLTFNKDLVIKIGDKTLVKVDDYTIKETDRGFELVVNDMKAYNAGDAIVITYSATVNENAEIGKKPNTNTVYLEYSNNPSDTYDNDPTNDVLGKTPERVTKTYVTQVSLQKTDADAKAFVDALKGATFTLSGTGLNDVKVLTETVFEVAANGEYYKLKDGTYTKTAPTEATTEKYDSTTDKYNTVTKVSLTNEESGEKLNITAVVDATGKITFTGLNAGTYKLEETNVPVGYNKCADIEFTITATQTGATKLVGGDITWASNNDAVVLDEANGVFDVTVANQKGNTLPSTGGVGTTIFYIVGGVLVLAAVVLLVTKKRMARN